MGYTLCVDAWRTVAGFGGGGSTLESALARGPTNDSVASQSPSAGRNGGRRDMWGMRRRTRRSSGQRSQSPPSGARQDQRCNERHNCSSDDEIGGSAMRDETGRWTDAANAAGTAANVGFGGRDPLQNVSWHVAVNSTRWRTSFLDSRSNMSHSRLVTNLMQRFAKLMLPLTSSIDDRPGTSALRPRPLQWAISFACNHLPAASTVDSQQNRIVGMLGIRLFTTQQGQTISGQGDLPCLIRIANKRATLEIPPSLRCSPVCREKHLHENS
jgi:hypothetical protein